MTIKAAIDKHILGDPFKKELPDYVDIWKDKYPTLEDSFEKLGIMKEYVENPILIRQLEKKWHKTPEELYEDLLSEYRSQIEVIIVGEL